MKFRNFFVFCVCVIMKISYIHSKFPDTDVSHTFDTDLYESILDPELCQKQLQYLQTDDIMLRLEFLESGLRIPRGILEGNFIDLGNYRQCLAINKELEDMSIKGKYCTISIPGNLNFQMQNGYTGYNMAFGPTELHFEEDYLSLLEQINKEKASVLAREGININRNDRSGSDTLNIELTLAVCLPQPCTTKEALSNLYFNMSSIELNYEEVSCRLPNDKPFVTADYVAWVIFALLGVITLLSTIYDVRHTIILKRDPKKASEVLNAFSVYKNSCELVKITQRPGVLECLDGIRALSTMWIILAHTAMTVSIVPTNVIFIFNWYMSVNSIWLNCAPLAVDTFFLLSGLLVVYTTAKKSSTMQLAKNLHVYYLSRILRILPVLSAVILFKVSFYHHISDGPMWVVPARHVQSCRTYWWVTILHLQNFLTPENGCLTESWYLAIDLHLHILSPLVLLWVLSGAKRIAWLALISGFLLSLTGATIYIFVKSFNAESPDVYALYYVNTLTRAPPYFVGMIYGYLLHLWREEKRGMRKSLGYSITAFSLGVLALILYCEHIFIHGDTTQTMDNFFRSFTKTVWAITIGWIIFACVNGCAGPINWFLSLSVWKIPSRISYSMYLSHITIMFGYYGSSLQLKYFSVASYMFDFFAFLYVTMFIGFFMTVLIDAPFATLIRLLFQGGNKHARKGELPTENEINTNNDDLFNSRKTRIKKNI